MTSTYEKPTWVLLLDALPDLPDPFTTTDAVAWFAERYPLLAASTIRNHVHRASLNRGAPDWFPREARVLWRLNNRANGKSWEYTRYDPRVHGVAP